jgi:hypothetical protein
MAIQYLNIFQSKALPNWNFWFENKPSGDPDPNGENVPTLVTLLVERDRFWIWICPPEVKTQLFPTTGKEGQRAGQAWRVPDLHLPGNVQVRGVNVL